jgi:nicotinate dehydrogenase subunit B
MEYDQLSDLEFLEHTSTFSFDRREFMKLAWGGIALFFVLGDPSVFAQQRDRRQLPTDFNAFLKISEDGRASLFTGKIEMGQGIVTSLGQMLADELDVTLESVDIVLGDTERCPWDMGTFGSMSTRFFGPALRNAGAEARMVLLELASDHLKIPVSNLKVEDGVVMSKVDAHQRVTYAELAKGKNIARRPTGKATLKKPSEFKVMGKSFVRRDGPDKVTGKAKYSGDIQVPGMVYAKILRPPSHQSKLVSVDVSGASQMKDVQVIKEGDFIAVLHKYPDVAERALSKIKANYETPSSDLDDKTIFDHLLKVAPKGSVVAHGGNLETGEHASTTVVESTYYDGYKAHAPMEPHTAMVQIEGKKVTVWASTQTPFNAKEEVAKELGVPSDDVRIVPPFLGGGFGGKSRNQQIVEAARLAKLSGKPVQVAWTRKEEFFYDSFRPAAVVKITSGISEKGVLSLWDYAVYFAGERGSQQFYSIPNHSTTVCPGGFMGGGEAHPFATGPWRAPANNTNTFARESQIDIMAAKAGIDPVEFRLQHLSDESMKRVIKAAVEKFKWTPAKGPSGRGYGIACGIDAGTTVATMAEVEVNKTTGEVKVKRVVCAQDMGLVINPEGATIQMEGCITMGLGYALREDIRFKGGEVLDVSFDTYEIPRFSWLPNIETVIVDNQESPPQGGGEPAIVTMGAVIANAIFDAVGARVYQMPMTPERVKEALKKA